MRAAARRPGRASTRARSASGSARGSTPPAGSDSPAPRSSCCSPTTPTRRGGSPTRLEELNRERQAVEGRILREAIAQVEEWPEAKRGRRAYVVAGEDWHEGVIGIVASRLVERFNRPVVLIAGGGRGDWKGSGRSVPAFDLHGGLARVRRASSSAGAATARPPGSRSVRRTSRRSPRRSPRTRRAPRRGGPAPGHARRRGRPGAGPADARALRRARPARAVRARQPRGDAARARLRARRPRGRRGGQAPALPRAPRRRRRRQRDRVRPRRRSSTRYRARTAATTSRSGSRRTTGTAPWRRSSSCAGSSTRATRFDGPARLARRRVPEAARRATRTRRRSSPSSGSTATAIRRHLLESARFRALLAEPPLARRVIVRAERESDFAQIHAVVDAAFGDEPAARTRRTRLRLLPGYLPDLALVAEAQRGRRLLVMLHARRPRGGRRVLQDSRRVGGRPDRQRSGVGSRRSARKG